MKEWILKWALAAWMGAVVAVGIWLAGFIGHEFSESISMDADWAMVWLAGAITFVSGREWKQKVG